MIIIKWVKWQDFITWGWKYEKSSYIYQFLLEIFRDPVCKGWRQYRDAELWPWGLKNFPKWPDKLHDMLKVVMDWNPDILKRNRKNIIKSSNREATCKTGLQMQGCLQPQPRESRPCQQHLFSGAFLSNPCAIPRPPCKGRQILKGKLLLSL